MQAPRSFQYSDPGTKQNRKGSTCRPSTPYWESQRNKGKIKLKRVFNKHRHLAKNTFRSEPQPYRKKPIEKTSDTNTTTDDSSASIEDDNNKNSNNATGSEIIISKESDDGSSKDLFSENLNIYLTTTDIVEMLQIDFSKELEENTLQLYERAMSLYITNEQVLPSDVGYTVITLLFQSSKGSRGRRLEFDSYP